MTEISKTFKSYLSPQHQNIKKFCTLTRVNQQQKLDPEMDMSKMLRSFRELTQTYANLNCESGVYDMIPYPNSLVVTATRVGTPGELYANPYMIVSLEDYLLTVYSEAYT
jgi:hypothetical protein